MSKIELNITLTLSVPSMDQLSNNQLSLTEIDFIRNELSDKLYVGVEHYPDDIFSCLNLNINTYELKDNNDQ